MLLIVKVVLVLIFINFSICETQNEGNLIYNFTSLSGDKINNIIQYCKDRLCIAKCCQGDTMFFAVDLDAQAFVCTDMKETENGMHFDGIYPPISIYKSNIETEIAKSKLKLENFTYVNNDRFFTPDLFTQNEMDSYSKFYILEDASLMIEDPNYYERWIKHLNGPTDYCLDMMIRTNRKGEKIRRIRFGRLLEDDTSSQAQKNLVYIAIAMLISSFFLVLVLVVYGLLPKLRNIVGMVLMGYVVSLLVWYTMKAMHNLLEFAEDTNKVYCPIMYFTNITSFFWLNIMSFDIWWTFRGTRKCRDIHRRGELVKFLWYCLYAWGTPLAVTIGIVVLDNSNVSGGIMKPHFNNCLYDVYENLFFTYVPIIILTVINCIMFFLTIYNIWLIHRGMRKFSHSRKNKNNENRFFIFIKMSVLMGVSWVLELIQSFAGIDATWLYILVNLCNASLGVIIFFLFVFKKSIFMMLCKRFHINNKYVTRMESNLRSKNTGDSSRKQISRTESVPTTDIDSKSIGTTDTMIELNDVNNMTDVSLNPR